MSHLDRTTHCLYCDGRLSPAAIRADRPLHKSCAKILRTLDELDEIGRDVGLETGGASPTDDDS